jgi:hypothetical protein
MKIISSLDSKENNKNNPMSKLLASYVRARHNVVALSPSYVGPRQSIEVDVGDTSDVVNSLKGLTASDTLASDMMLVDIFSPSSSLSSITQPKEAGGRAGTGGSGRSAHL